MWGCARHMWRRPGMPRAAAARAARTDRFHVVAGVGLLTCTGPPMVPKGRRGQDGRRHGRGLRRNARLHGVDLDGRSADRPAAPRFDGRRMPLAAFAEHAETPSSPVGSSMRSTTDPGCRTCPAHGHRRRDRRAVRDHRLRRPTTAVTPRRTRRAPRAQRRGGSVVRQQT